MKVAYLGKIQLSDVDLSYLHELEQICDVTTFMEVNPRFQRGPAFNFSKIYPKTGIFRLTEAYPEYSKYDGYINLDKFYVVNTCGRLWQLKAFWTNILLLIVLIRGQFQAIHLAWPANIYEFVLYILRSKMLLTVHDPFPHTGLDTFIVRLRRKVAFKLIPRLIILNKAQREEFISYYRLQPSKIISSRLSSYNYLQTVSADNSKIPTSKYILFAGKISPYKGVEYLLNAMTEVHKSHPDCTLVVAGGGDYHFDKSAYEQLDYIDIRNRFIPDEELVSLIKGCEFMVCPYTDATQSGVIMSAFAFNKPVIATRVGGLPEMVIDNKYGILIKEKDANAITEGINKFLSEPELVVQFTHEIAENYGKGEQSWTSIARDLYSEYTK